jgi:regulator of protease activity HflC (stomatin/prohibitin superfamily)
MVNYVSGLIFAGLAVIGAGLGYGVYQFSAPSVVAGFCILWLLADAAVAAAVRLAAEWERAVVFRFGKLQKTTGPGLFIVIPFIDHAKVIDTRIQSINIADQSVITKDNVPITVDGVLFFQVTTAADALTKVRNYVQTITQYAKTALRDVIGQMTLDQLMAEREKIEKAIETAVERDTGAWGLRVTGIRIEDISFPEELTKMMSRQASAEREKRATITKAEGDKEAAIDLADAARTMTQSPGAMQLRTLQTIDGLGPNASNTVVFAVPMEIIEAIQTVRDAAAAKKTQP